MEEVVKLTKLYFENFEGFLTEVDKLAKVGLINYGIISRKHKYISIKGTITTSIYDGIDPVNVMVLLAMALYGQQWIYMKDCKKAFKEINRWWRDRVKATNTKGRSR